MKSVVHNCVAIKKKLSMTEQELKRKKIQNKALIKDIPPKKNKRFTIYNKHKIRLVNVGLPDRSNM